MAAVGAQGREGEVAGRCGVRRRAVPAIYRRDKGRGWWPAGGTGSSQ
jgi:hypothetical protein